MTPEIDPQGPTNKARFNVNVSDNDSGVQRITINITGPNNNVISADYLSLDASVDLTAEITSATFSESAAAGTWTITLITIDDLAGNRASYDTAALQSFSYPTQLTVIEQSQPIEDENTAPEVFAVNVETLEDTAIAGELKGQDADGDTLNFRVVDRPRQGTVELLNSENGRFRYTPSEDANGRDSFTFTADDGLDDANVATVNITIRAVNDAPQALNNSRTGMQNQELTAQLTGRDVDGDTLTYSLVTTPMKGSLVIDNTQTGDFTYTPTEGEYGQDQFTFQISDGQANSNIATFDLEIKRDLVVSAFEVITKNVSGGDERPLISAALTLSSPVDQFQEFRIRAAGPNNQSLELVRAPRAGDVYPIVLLTQFDTNNATLEAGTWHFTEVRVKRKDEFFSFVIERDLGAAGFDNSFVVTQNQSPTIPPSLSYEVELGKVLNEQLIAVDLDNDPLTFHITDEPDIGSFELTNDQNGAFSYTPHDVGDDRLSFYVTDGVSKSSTRTVAITVTPPQDAPVANAKAFNVIENSSYRGRLSAVDPLDAPLQYLVVDAPAKGVLSIVDTNTGEFIYVPNPDIEGEDAFTFKARSEFHDSNTATVSITIDPSNGQPIAQNDTITVFENISYSGQLTAQDIDQDLLTFSLTDQPNMGSIELDSASGEYVYTPNQDRSGEDSFSYRVNDGKLDSAIATININILDHDRVCRGDLARTRIDSDSDGFSDVIEMAYGSNIDDRSNTPDFSNGSVQPDFSDDNDLDGYSDQLEAWIGSAPYSEGSRPNRDQNARVPDCFLAQNDGINPRLFGFHIETDVIDIASEQREVQFALTVGDNASGVKRIRVNLTSPSGAFISLAHDFAENENLASLRLASAPLSPFAEEGEWSVFAIFAYDYAGNRLSLSESELQTAGYPTRIAVSNSQSDANAPMLSNFVVETATVDPSTGRAKMHFSVSATDDQSGVRSARVDLISPSGVMLSAQTIAKPAKLSTTLTLETAMLNDHLEDGTWTIYSVLLEDQAGNVSQWGHRLTANGYRNEVTVTNSDSDSTAATLDGFSILTPVIYPSAGDATATFALSASDNLSGIDKLHIRLRGPSSQTVSVWGYLQSTQPLDVTTQLTTTTFNALTELGDWVVDQIEIFDAAGHHTSLSTAELEALGYNTTIRMSAQ